MALFVRLITIFSGDHLSSQQLLVHRGTATMPSNLLHQHHLLPCSRAMRTRLFALLLCLAFAKPLYAETPKTSVVAVHPGTELLHVINYLAGIAPPMVATYSYRTAVDEWFAAFASHPAVEHAKSLPYNDFVELGWAFDDATMALTMPQGFGWQGALKDPEFLKVYLELSEDFAAQSDFLGFFASQQDNYQLWVDQFESRLNELNPEPALWDFFGITDLAEADTILYYSISPLGVTLRANMIMEEVSPQHAHYGVMLVPFDPMFLDGDTYTTPDFNYTDIALQHAVWHEGSHLIYEPLVEGFRDQLGAVSYQDCFSRVLTPFDDDALNMYFFIHEVVADSVSILLKSEYVSEEAAEEHLVLNENIGGYLYRPMFEHFRDVYFAQRHETDFRAHLPQLIDFINSVPTTKDCE